MSHGRWCSLPAGVAQVCAEQLGAELPFPVRLPEFGRTPEERREVVADAHRFLAEAGLGGAGPDALDPVLAEQVLDVCGHAHGYTLVLAYRDPADEAAELRALAAQRGGRWVAAVLQDERLHLASLVPEPDGHPVADLLALLPPAEPSPLPVVSVPGGAALAEAGAAWDQRGMAAGVDVLVRHGATGHDARAVLEVHAGALLTGQLSVQSALPGRSRRTVSAAPVTVHQGPLGRHALLRRPDGWVTQLPDGPGLVAAVDRHLAERGQLDPLVGAR